MIASEKILPLDELAKKLAEIQAQNLKVVLCHGVFDLLHLGHMRYFEQARKLGDFMVVTVTPNRFVNKGPQRPVFSEALRAEAIAALGVVDFVAVNRWSTAAETIRMLRPDVYCKGGEFSEMEGDLPAGLQAEVEAVAEVGGRVEFTADNLLSSSNLINAHLDVFPPGVENWLREFRDRHSIDEVLEYIRGSSGLKALVVGEAIIDEYVFCNALGKSTKDPILAFQYGSTESYAGGSLAVANHLAGFCDEVGLVTLLGQQKRREAFVRQALCANVRPHFITHQGAPTIHKRRFVDAHTNTRMFELYLMDDASLRLDNERELLATLDGLVDAYDVVVVVDYGHGMLSPPAIDLLCSRAKFLTVNTQANAGNRGFNTISKYARADYVCLAMHEVMLETRMRHADWHELVLEVVKCIDCSHFTVTWGKEGSLHYTSESGFVEAPALASHVTDRVGAGDAVLAVTALLVAQKTPWDIVGFVGNLAGAQVVAELGNRTTVSQNSIAAHATSLMK